MRERISFKLVVQSVPSSCLGLFKRGQDTGGLPNTETQVAKKPGVPGPDRAAVLPRIIQSGATSPPRRTSEGQLWITYRPETRNSRTGTLHFTSTAVIACILFMSRRLAGGERERERDIECFHFHQTDCVHPFRSPSPPSSRGCGGRLPEIGAKDSPVSASAAILHAVE